MKKIIICLCAALFLLNACTPADAGGTSGIDTIGKATEDNMTAAITEASNKELLPDDTQYIKWYGRVKTLEDKRVRFDNTASGFEVHYKGKTLTFTVSGTAYDNPDMRVYLTVYLDGEESVHSLDKKTNTITVSAEDGEHTVKVLKRSEASMSVATLEKIVTDGTFVEASAHSGYLIEFYGDSITCGYGNAASPTDTFSTATEDGLATYAYLTAEALGAECSVLAGSGMAIETNIWNADLKIPHLLDRYSTSDSDTYTSDTAPQIVVICGGVNDNTYIYTTQNMQEREKRAEAFTRAYKDFILAVRAKYPDAYIFCCANIYGEGSTLGTYIKLAIEQSGISNVKYILLPTRNHITGIGADGHPNYEAHEKIAKALTSKIKSALGTED